MEDREYRISQGHDAAAALVCNGKVVAAAAEERFDGKKHSPHFPAGAIEWALGDAGICLGDIDEVVHSFDYEPYREIYCADPVTLEFYDQVVSGKAILGSVHRAFPNFPLDRVRSVNHHLAHAASAFYTSGWDECLTVVIDAMGEVHGVTVYESRGNELKRVRSFSAQDSIGILYSLLTLHLGFDFNSDEYKIMGLAPYGDPSRYRKFFQEQVLLRDDGSIHVPLLRLNKTRDERENYLASRSYLGLHLIRARKPEEEITNDHRDIAAALQECLDRVMIHICGVFQKKTGLSRLAMAGGVALNCTANGRLLRSGLFEDIYIQPAAGDDGTALGAALYRAAEAGEVQNKRSPVPFFGPFYCENRLRQAIAEAGNRITTREFPTLEDTCAEAARLLADGAVLGWYRGRMEFGPRALGNRSIIANPGDPEMRSRINKMVKKREAFRPFGPAVSIEEAADWFDLQTNEKLPYMITIVDVRPEWRAQLPSITHVDGSARVQTVSEKDNAPFHALLKAVGRTTGRQMVLNTSFNVKGQPIVNTPKEAIDTFLNTEIDCLFLENRLITRNAG
jgi:carbamoyltransferase